MPDGEMHEIPVSVSGGADSMALRFVALNVFSINQT